MGNNLQPPLWSSTETIQQFLREKQKTSCPLSIVNVMMINRKKLHMLTFSTVIAFRKMQGYCVTSLWNKIRLSLRSARDQPYKMFLSPSPTNPPHSKLLFTDVLINLELILYQQARPDANNWRKQIKIQSFFPATHSNKRPYSSFNVEQTCYPYRKERYCRRQDNSMLKIRRNSGRWRPRNIKILSIKILSFPKKMSNQSANRR